MSGCAAGSTAPAGAGPSSACPTSGCCIFFLLPFLIVVAMSLATRAMTAPPFAFAPDFPFVDLANYRRLFEDSLYVRAFLVSLGNAALATLLHACCSATRWRSA